MGPTGGFLRSRLRIMNLLPLATFMNSVSCYPKEDPDGKPTPDQLQACRGNLKAQLEIVESPWVLAVGRYALVSMLRHAKSITASQGKIIPVHGKLVFPIFHPSYILRLNDPILLHKWEGMIEQFAHMMAYNEVVEPEQCYYCEKLPYPNMPVCYSHRNDWRLDQMWDPPGRRRRKGIPGQEEMFG